MAEPEEPGDRLGKKTELIVLDPAAGSMLVPAMIAAAGERSALRFIDFFTANIRNPNTRAAYAVAVRGLFAWLDQRDIRELGAICTHHVSAYMARPATTASVSAWYCAGRVSPGVAR